MSFPRSPSPQKSHPRTSPPPSSIHPVRPSSPTPAVVLMGSSANPKSRPHLLSQLTRAHVICLVYSICEPSSFDRVAEYWLPLFRREGINVGLASRQGTGQEAEWSLQVPVILVGNKIDLRGGEVTNQGLEDEIAPIMREFKVRSARGSSW